MLSVKTVSKSVRMPLYYGSASYRDGDILTWLGLIFHYQCWGIEVHCILSYLNIKYESPLPVHRLAILGSNAELSWSKITFETLEVLLF